MLKLVALVLPLGLDTFAVSAALGLGGVPRGERLRLSLLFALFEGGMPLVGLLLGNATGAAIGAWAEYVAIAALVATGVYMAWPRDDVDEQRRLNLLRRTHGVAVLGLGLSISLDELAIGFAIGLLRLPVALAVGLIVVQAFVVTQFGLRLGAVVGEAVREWAERLAGAALVLLGLGLLAARLAGISL
ncbi:MAG: manganese efflux pump MntP family protein [Candidatus Dormibacteraeota bacterium]|nr:manganese efflux pump MntP family protein [Candidatus Dormibacteraeota bacterium]